MVIAIIALTFFSSAYSKRQEPPIEQNLQQIEMQAIGAKLDELADRLEKLKSDMAAVKRDLIKSRNRIAEAH
jgi:hypothetical protein